LFIDSDVSTIFVEFFLEIRTLRSVGNCVIRKQLPQFFLECNEPVFSCACLHSGVVFPVDIDSIEVVLKDEIAQLDSTVSGVDFGSSGELSGTEYTDQDLDSSIIVLFLEVLLDLVFSGSEDAIGSKVLDGISPDIYNIERARAVAPEGKGNVVV
jgi:hypothetical protein